MVGGKGAPAPTRRTRPRRRPATPIVTEHTHGQQAGATSNYRRGAAPTGGPGRAQVASAQRLVAKKNLRVQDVQAHLRRAGYKIAVDGVWGPQTATAWRNYAGALQRSQQADYLSYSHGAPQGEHARVAPPPRIGRTVTLRGATPAVPSFVTEHTRGQAIPAIDTRREAPGGYLPPDVGQSISIIGGNNERGTIDPITRAAKLDNARRVRAYLAGHPHDPVADTAAGLTRLLGTNIEAALLPPVGPTAQLQRKKTAEANVLDVGAGKQLLTSTYESIRHPARDPVQTALNIGAIAGGGTELAARLAGGVRAASEAEAGARIPSALEALRKPGRPEALLPRRAIGHPETGTRLLRVGRLEVQPPTQSPSVLTAVGQHLADRFSELPRVQRVPIVGAPSRARRIVAAEHGVNQMRAAGRLAPLGESIRALRSKVPGKYTGEEMAYSLIARNGHIGAEGVDLVDRELAQRRAALAQLDPAKDARRIKRAERRIALIEKARPYVEKPTPALITALQEGKIVSAATTSSKVARGAMAEKTATEAAAHHIRAVHGAEFVPPTPTRLGKETGTLAGGRARALNIEKAYGRAVEQAQRLKFSGADEKRLGLKSPALVERQKKLAEEMKTLRARLKAPVHDGGIPTGTTAELEARSAAIDAEWQKVVDAIAGQSRDAKFKGTGALQKQVNAANRKGEKAPIVADMLRKEAEQKATAMLAANAHLPWVQNIQHKLAEYEAIDRELGLRDARASGEGGKLLHPYLPTTEAAVKEQLRRVSVEHNALKGRVEKLPVGMADVSGLRAQIRVEEKHLRQLEARWNEPASLALEERASLHRSMRGGSGAQKELAGAIGGQAAKHGLGITGIEDLQARINQLTEHVQELRGKAPEELIGQRKVVNELRSELRKATKARGHIEPGELPYGVTAKGEIVRPIGHAKVVRLGGARSVLREQLATAEKRAAAGVTDTGLVTPKHLLPAHATAEEAGKALDKALKDAGLTRQEAGVRRVVNTADMQPDEAHGAMFGKEGGVAEAIHVTDNPAVATRVLRSGKPVAEARKEGLVGDLGTSGLHVSDVPDVWGGRSQAKWEFVKNLTGEQRAKIADALTIRLRELHRSKSITYTEQAYALGDVRAFKAGTSDAVLAKVANQPYNVPVASPGFLKPLGIEPGPQAAKVPVTVRGSFAELTGTAKPATIDALKKAGFDGAFTKGSISTTPQLVVWNNHAIRQFGDLTTVDPHLLEPGPLGFHISDRPHVGKIAQAARGRIASLNPPRNEVTQWTGSLWRQGREVPGPRATYRDARNEIAHQDRVRRSLIADKVAEPYNADKFNAGRGNYELYDPQAAIPGRKLPYGTKRAIAAEKRAAYEMPIEHPDEALDPQLILKRLAGDHQAWFERAFPKAQSLSEAQRGDLLMVHKSWAHAIRGEDTYHPGLPGKILDFLNQLNRSALIYLNPSYIPVQGTGNAIYLGLQQGAFAPLRIARYVKRYRSLDPADQRRITLEVGGGAAQFLAHEGRSAGPLTRLADVQNYGADKYPRDIAWLHEAHKMGYQSPAEIHALLTEPKLEKHLNVVTTRAENAMVKFRRAPTAWRRMIGRAIFIAPWMEGSTRWIGRFIADKPFTAAVANSIRDHIIAEQKRVLKGGKAVTGGFIPTAIPQKLASKATFGLLPKAATSIGGLSVIPGVNPDAISPAATGTGVAKTIGEIVGLEGTPLHGGTRLLASIQPAIGAGVAAAIHRDPYSGYQYPANKSFGSILAEQTVGSVDHPALPAAALVKTFLDKPPDYSKTKASKLPTYYGESGWRAGLERTVLGSARTRYAITKGITAKGAAAARAAATGNPRELAKIKTKAEIQKGYVTRNSYLAAAQKYGIIPAGGQLPTVVTDAIRLRTIRNLNYIQHGAKTEGQKLAADAALLLRRGLITPETQAATLAWIKEKQGTLPEDIASERTKVGRKFFGAKTLADASHELHKAKRKKLATAGG